MGLHCNDKNELKSVSCDHPSCNAWRRVTDPIGYNTIRRFRLYPDSRWWYYCDEHYPKNEKPCPHFEKGKAYLVTIDEMIVDKPPVTTIGFFVDIDSEETCWFTTTEGDTDDYIFAVKARWITEIKEVSVEEVTEARVNNE